MEEREERTGVGARFDRNCPDEGREDRCDGGQLDLVDALEKFAVAVWVRENNPKVIVEEASDSPI
jgi:hypothetical protein